MSTPSATNGRVNGSVPTAPDATRNTQHAIFVRIYPGVVLGEGCEIEDFVIIGQPPKGAAPGELPTIIGPGAVIRSHTVIYAGNVIGAGFQTGHGALVRESNTIGDHVSVGSHSVVEHHVVIED